MRLLALSPNFGKGLAVTIAGVILFVGSVYVVMSAFMGRVMAYLVIAVSLFAWMIILSTIWTFGANDGVFTLKSTGIGTPRYQGPRGTEPHWEVIAAGIQDVKSKYPQTVEFPDGPWRAPTAVSQASVATVKTAFQKYLTEQAKEQLEKQGTKVCLPTEAPEPNCFVLDPATFIVTDVKFATTEDGTHLAAGHTFYTLGGPEVTLFAFHAKGNVPIYSVSFLVASILGLGIHLPFLDRAEKKRKAILTGGTAPPWYGPA
jgi:hypothetical protein